MAFPIIPTVANGRIIGRNQADAVATRTSPDLSTLTKSSGDLLLCIVIAYQAGVASAGFSNWTAGWTEIVDQPSSTTGMAIGAAIKTSTGSETGTVSCLQASVTGHATIIVMAISGVDTGTTPEATAIAVANNAAANPALLDPVNWAAEDTLWVSVAGSGETSTTGSWTGTSTTPPTNYTNPFNIAGSDVLNGSDGAVAFRQLNATSEDVGTWVVDTSNNRSCALVIAVRPVVVTAVQKTLSPSYIVKNAVAQAVSPNYNVKTEITQALAASYTVKQAVSKDLSASYNVLPAGATTGVAQISLASGGTPSARTGHVIHIRARVQSGTGTIHAALYEGANNRSGDLETSITSSFAQYDLTIAEANAANITDYNNLELRIWGTATSSVTFEVSQVSLETPPALANVQQTLSPNYFVRTEIAQTLSASYAVRTSVSQSLAASYTLRGAVSKNLAATYSVRQAISKALTANYNIVSVGQVSKSLSATYNVKVSLQKPLAASYSVRAIVSKPLAASYIVRGAIDKALSAAYVVRASLQKGLTANYNVIAFLNVSQTLTANYIVRTILTKPLAATYTVQAAILKSLSTSYNILAAGGVSKSLGVNYTVRSIVTQTFTPTYTVFGRIRRNLTVTYQVAEAWYYMTGTEPERILATEDDGTHVLSTRNNVGYVISTKDDNSHLLGAGNNGSVLNTKDDNSHLLGAGRR